MSLLRSLEWRRTARLFGERSWALGLVGVVAASVLFILLGRWQFHRHEGKVERRDLLHANYAAAPVSLDALLPGPSASLRPADQWRQVRASGSYDVAGTVLVRNRVLAAVYGYEVLVPLRLDDGALLLVDRGWIPNGQTGAHPDTVPAAPTGPVNVVVRLRPGEPPTARVPPPGQALRMDLPRIAGALDAPVYRAYGVLAAETPSPPTSPVLLPRPADDLGPHLAYAVQWWAFALTAYLLLGYYALREAERRIAAENGLPAPESPVARARAGSRGSRGAEPGDEEW